MIIKTKNCEVEIISLQEVYVRIGNWEWYFVPPKHDFAGRTWMEQLTPEKINPKD